MDRSKKNRFFAAATVVFLDNQKRAIKYKKKTLKICNKDDVNFPIR